MPPFLVLTLGAIGAFAAARWIAREARRINAELHPQAPEPDPSPVETLKRDPVTGVYRAQPRG
ncbi:MAG: hypothetical protein J0H62_08605 [Rhizobiales bacterium]|nr:hypothetical protein [Hyphomicrobiales bacterium]